MKPLPPPLGAMYAVFLGVMTALLPHGYKQYPFWLLVALLVREAAARRGEGV